VNDRLLKITTAFATFPAFVNDRIVQIPTAIATVLLFCLALLMSAPPPPPSIVIPGEVETRSVAGAILPSLFFLGFIYLHNGRKHVVNAGLTLIFFFYAWGVGQWPAVERYYQ